LINILEEEFSRLGLPLSSAAAEKFSVYVRLLEQWNKAVNLTALSHTALVTRLIGEPAWIGEKLQMSGGLLDVGSGNGSPGVPLFISRGLAGVDLVEPRARRAAFLRHIAKHLGSAGIVVHRARLEELKDPPARVDWVTFQGLKPSAFAKTLKRMLPGTTNVVWITTAEVSEGHKGAAISVPGSKTIARVFQLDQF
jgi:16S rRNA (guanine527-N7)-methyltransferase